ncbi:translation machinery-associated protein 17 [[Candida] railenensis]|uniref:Translation machinery-associated protein 17 n=1 Tax=[Candida] railenensis TaxID=45579 RepID=A0A9P0VZU1_9ASCO|nr:translation machinery-associated protein 17 [[Candida] railenensis]
MSSNSKPIQIEEFILAIKDLSDENLKSILSQLDNSISKLVESNETLAQEIETTKEAVSQLKPEESHEELKQDLVLYTETIEENNEVIANQKERVTQLNIELGRRGLKEPPSESLDSKAKELYL